MPGLIFVRRLESSASVRATAAMASGLACRFDIIVVAECCKQCASVSKVSSFDIVAWTSCSCSTGERGG